MTTQQLITTLINQELRKCKSEITSHGDKSDSRYQGSTIHVLWSRPSKYFRGQLLPAIKELFNEEIISQQELDYLLSESERFIDNAMSSVRETHRRKTKHLESINPGKQPVAAEIKSLHIDSLMEKYHMSPKTIKVALQEILKK